MQATNIQYFSGTFHGSREMHNNRGLMQGEEDPEATARTYELMEVLEFFPDVEAAFALDLLEEEEYDGKKVCDRLAYMNGNYPRDNDNVPNLPTIPIIDGTTHQQQHQHQQQRQQHALDDLDSLEPQLGYDFMSPASFVPSRRYKLQSREQLLCHFPFLDARKAKVLSKANASHFAITHDAICRAVREKSSTALEPDNGRKFDELLLAALFDQSSLTPHELSLLSEIFNTGQAKRKFTFSLLIRRKRKVSRITCPILQEEVRFVKEKSLELNDILQKGIAKRSKRQAAVQDGTAMQCSCCYEDVAMDEMVACKNEGHLFCENCLASYVEALLFGQGNLGVDPQTKEAATEVLCCHSDGCSSGFARFYLEKALQPKVVAKYDELQAQTAIERVPGLRENM
jgi:hypothetical protein